MDNNHTPITTDHLIGTDYPNVIRVSADRDYWLAQSPSELVWGYFCLELIRRFEQVLLERDVERIIHGPVHSSIGQEAVAVGMAMALTSDDQITSTHRAHHHFLAKAVAHYGPPTDDPTSWLNNDGLRDCVRRTMAEIMGLKTGWIGGRGGSMHLFDDTSGVIGTQAIVAGNIPFTSGVAYAQKYRGKGHVALAFLGDGAVSIGPFHEGICIATVYKLPAIFVIENNQYGVSTPAREATSLVDLAVRAAGYNIPGLIVDGMNPLAMKRAVATAKAHAAAGHGPVIIEAKTYRFFHQSGGMPGSNFGYRTKQEEKEWLDQDPLKSSPKALTRRGILDENGIQSVQQIAEELVADALDYCTEVHEEKRRLRPELIPAPEEADREFMSDGHEFADVNFRELSSYSDTQRIKVNTAKSQIIAHWMEKDPTTFVSGEDVANLKGGPYGATRDAVKRFKERVHNAPIAEGGIIGLGHGAAVMGMRAISESMFCDFALIGADELFNQVATCRYMYHGRVDVPLVVRSRCSAGRGYGAQHSGDTIGQFALYPGWRIVAPTTPYDYIGLFNTAMQSLDPVLVLEHHEIDPLDGDVPSNDLDYFIPFGSAAVRREGTDLTLICYLSIVPRVLKIAEELDANHGINVEVIDLRSLDHASLDFETIQNSTNKTGQVLIVEQAMEPQSIGTHIAARIHENFHGQLRQPVRRLCSMNVPMPVSLSQELTVLISDDKIRDGIRQMMGKPAEIS